MRRVWYNTVGFYKCKEEPGVVKVNRGVACVFTCDALATHLDPILFSLSLSLPSLTPSLYSQPGRLFHILLLVFIPRLCLNLPQRRVVGRRGVTAGVTGARLFGLDAALGVGGGRRGGGRRVGVGGGAALALLLLRRCACTAAGR